MDEKMIDTLKALAVAGMLGNTETWAKAMIRDGKRELAVAVVGEAVVVAAEKAAERKFSASELAMGRVHMAGYRAMCSQFDHEVRQGHIKPLCESYNASNVGSYLEFLASRTVRTGESKGDPIGMTGGALAGVTFNGSPVNLSIRLDGRVSSRAKTPEAQAKAEAKRLAEARELVAKADAAAKAESK